MKMIQFAVSSLVDAGTQNAMKGHQPSRPGEVDTPQEAKRRSGIVSFGRVVVARLGQAVSMLRKKTVAARDAKQCEV